jgi:hypothetical protein
MSRDWSVLLLIGKRRGDWLRMGESTIEGVKGVIAMLGDADVLCCL